MSVVCNVIFVQFLILCICNVMCLQFVLFYICDMVCLLFLLFFICLSCDECTVCNALYRYL